MVRFWLVVLLIGYPTVSRAADPALSVGATEAIGVPDGAPLGAYPYVAVSLALPVAGVAIIPGLGVEYSPDAARWGFVGTLTLDVPFSARISGDLLIGAAHDQSGGDWDKAVFLVGGGVGISIATEQLVVSPSLSVYAAINASGWSVCPGLNFAHVF
jgi:hypothetical protein